MSPSRIALIPARVGRAPAALLFAAFVLASPLWLRAQPVDQLAAAYSGKLSLDQASATLCFSGPGNIHFTNAGVRSFLWQIPAEVKHVRGGWGNHSDGLEGGEELYDMQADPNEWHNLAAQPGHAAVIAEHRKWLPPTDVPPAPGRANRVLTYDQATDEAVWKGKPVKRGDPIPQ